MFRDSKNTKVLSFKSTYKLPVYVFENKNSKAYASDFQTRTQSDCN